MSQIDIQNAKQIRDPMTVLISMEVPEDVAVTYSDFQNVKIEDAQLGQRAWPMRQLADLQGEGFALDGSRSLYDPSVTASAANGKIGVRGDVGEDVTFTVSGDSNINGLSLAATGTDRVLFNGQTATFSDGQVIIPVGSDSITLTFPAEETDRRVEVSFTLPGTSLKVTNDSIISCIVSLRSDLSIEDPTLPESELNVDIYNDVDISEAVASIPDDSPLIYSAGYPGDMSPDRKFYVAGQITWADNVLSIHAVDAVHFLDAENDPVMYPRYDTVSSIAKTFYSLIGYILQNAGINVDLLTPTLYAPLHGNYAYLVLPRISGREAIAFFNNVIKLKSISTDYFSTGKSENFWLSYVDAGIPSVIAWTPTPKWVIYENDCGDTKVFVEVKISSINVEHTRVTLNHVFRKSFATVNWVKEDAGFVDFGEYLSPQFSLEFLDDNGNYIDPTLPAAENGASSCSPKPISVRVKRLADGADLYFEEENYLFDGEGEQNKPDKNGGVVYSRVVPWGPTSKGSKFNTQKAAWENYVEAGYIGKDDTSASVSVSGFFATLNTEAKKYSKGSRGKEITITEKTFGEMFFSKYQTYNREEEAFPKLAYESLLQRSNVTGSFIWKGDPRMQPRDVVEFHRLDGTVEEITLENITLHHEGGGTYAEITYRKGVC